MSNLPNNIQSSAIESALVLGDLSKLNTDQRLSYYKNVCDSVGLNYLTKPFDYIHLNGKLTLYAKRDATDQLRKVHSVSIKITNREKFDDIYVVTAQASDKTGRYDESTGAVNVAGLKGDALANAYLKAETKAKRRVTLSLCGLGLLDETEVQSIADAKPFNEAENTAQEVSKLLNESGFREAASQPIEKNEPKEYVIPFGKHKDKTFSQINLVELQQYINWIPDGLKGKDDKPVTGKLKLLMEETYREGLAYIGKRKDAAMSQKEPEAIDVSEELPS